MPRRRRNRLGEGALARVVVQEILFLKIVRDVHVGTPIHVQVTHHQTQSKAVDAAEDSGFRAHVLEVPAIVPKQPTSGAGVAHVAPRCIADREFSVRRVAEQEHVQVAIAVVVEKRRLRRVADVRQPILLGTIGEGAVAVIDVQHVTTVHGEITHRRHVDIQLPVAIHIGHRHAGFPARRTRDARLLRHILEVKVAAIQIQLVGPNI